MAVTFVNRGRMGNYLFQCATAYAYSLKHSLAFTVPTKTNDKYWNPLYLQHLAKPMPVRPNIIIKEKGHEYQELPFDESWRNKNIILDGYFQSELYFKEYREEILKAFEFYWYNVKGVISIHVRRGDYLMYTDKHPPVTMDYYNKAIAMFPNDYFFRVFSDDIPWCKQNFIGEKFSFSENRNEIQDLTDISCCESQICSSSTFAIWGYWLNQNPNKIGVFPEKWFVDGHNGLITKDILPPEVIKIPND